jgi:glutamyl-tRNA synthetase
MPENVRVRFAPSPTGPLHIGGVRTALFNYLFAKKQKGTFVLRIEDTDQTRYVTGAENYIIESLHWCGINIDEGVVTGGEHTPYRQSERKPIYQKYADQLVNAGKAYYAFDTPEELEQIRQEFEKDGKTFAYDITSRMSMKNSISLPPEDVDELLATGVPYVIRFQVPEDVEVVMEDMVRGTVKVHSSTVDDKILFKADGLPTYHLANVVDDYLMKITHVIRGEEWLPSLPLHVLLYKAFEWEPEMPVFAHLPLILKPTGKGKLSKRDGDKMGFPVFPLKWKSPEGEIYAGFREDGYFPEAVVNLLALLGWNPGNDEELFTMDELIQLFELDRVGKSGSRFDPEKAKWFNHQYLQKKEDDKLAKELEIILKANGVEKDIGFIKKVAGLLKERASFVKDIWHQGYYFFKAPDDYDKKTVKKRWKQETPKYINDVRHILANTEPFDAPTTEEAVKHYIESNELSFGAIMNPLRLTIVGAPQGPHLFDILEVIGKEETVFRIDKALEVLPK